MVALFQRRGAALSGAFRLRPLRHARLADAHGRLAAAGHPRRPAVRELLSGELRGGRHVRGPRPAGRLRGKDRAHLYGARPGAARRKRPRPARAEREFGRARLRRRAGGGRQGECAAHSADQQRCRSHARQARLFPRRGERRAPAAARRSVSARSAGSRSVRPTGRGATSSASSSRCPPARGAKRPRRSR